MLILGWRGVDRIWPNLWGQFMPSGGRWVVWILLYLWIMNPKNLTVQKKYEAYGVILKFVMFRVGGRWVVQILPDLWGQYLLEVGGPDFALLWIMNPKKLTL